MRNDPEHNLMDFEHAVSIFIHIKNTEFQRKIVENAKISKLKFFHENWHTLLKTSIKMLSESAKKSWGS